MNGPMPVEETLEVIDLQTFCVKFTREAYQEVGMEQPVRYIKASEVFVGEYDYSFVNLAGQQIALIPRKYVASIVEEGPAEFYAEMELCDALQALRGGRNEREKLILSRWSDIVRNNLIDDTPIRSSSVRDALDAMLSPIVVDHTVREYHALLDELMEAVYREPVGEVDKEVVTDDAGQPT